MGSGVQGVRRWLTGVKQLAVSAGADLVNHGGLQCEGKVINTGRRRSQDRRSISNREASKFRTPDIHLQVEEHATRHVLAGASLREESVEGVIAATDSLVRGHLAVRLDSMLQAVELPAGVADLYDSIMSIGSVECGRRRGTVHSSRSVAQV